MDAQKEMKKDEISALWMVDKLVFSLVAWTVVEKAV